MGKRQDRSDNLKRKRERFEEAGAFPVRKVAVIGVAIFVILFGGAFAYQNWQASQAVGGAAISADVDYSAQNIPSADLAGVEQTADGLVFSAAAVQQASIASLTYQRETPMPAEYQEITGGDALPLLAYVAPSGRLVVATSFCEPCRSSEFHIEGDALVCNVCFTKWDLDTLQGLGGGCADYPPEEVTTQVEGDQVLVSKADLEAWTPRAF